MTSEKFNALLSFTEGLMNHVYWLKQDLNVTPSKEHHAVSINYTDISERRVDFLRELVNSITEWVYSKQKVQEIFSQRMSETGGSMANASTHLTQLAFSKFRPGHPQGQFGELLLFNFIQYFFGAVPILRKMRITTSVGHERFGADAIHYKYENDQNQLILGESKCYESSYQFNTAFNASVNSVCGTFNRISSEIASYIHDDFIEPELESIAKSYKNNTLPNVHFELVCLVIYNETTRITGSNEAEIKASIKSIIENRCAATTSLSCFTDNTGAIIDRINYIIFPVWKLDELLDAFSKQIGIE